MLPPPARAPWWPRNGRRSFLWAGAWLNAIALLSVLIKLNGPRAGSWHGAVGIATALVSYWMSVAFPLITVSRHLRAKGVLLPFRALAHLALFAVVAIGAGALQHALASLFGYRRPASVSAATFLYLDWNLACFASVLMFGAISERLRDRARLARRELQLAREVTAARLEALTRQIQPHFLFNALNSIAELADAAPASAARMLQQLRALFESTFTRSDGRLVPLEEELRSLAPYVEIEQTRFADRLSVEYEIAPAVRTALVPPLILQPIVENAIRHGLARDDAPGDVHVRAYCDASTLHLDITNGSRGSASPSHGLGIGLRNTRERLRHAMGPSAALTLHELANGGARVSIDAPLLTASESHSVSPSAPTHAATFLQERDERGSVLQFIARTPVAVLIVTGWTAAWVFWTFQMHFYRLARGIHIPILPASIADAWSAALWALATPLILYLGKRFRIEGPHRWRRVALHALLAFVTTFAHVAAIRGLGLLGNRSFFDPANLDQMVLNVMLYVLLLAVPHARALEQWIAERQTASARTEAALAQARLEARALDLHPELLSAALDRLAARMEHAPHDAELDVVALAETLRRILLASEQDDGMTSDEAEQAEAQLRQLASGAA